MRRAFFHINSKLRKSESHELQKTLKYLTGGLRNPKTLSSLFNNSTSSSSSPSSSITGLDSLEKDDPTTTVTGTIASSVSGSTQGKLKPQHYKIRKNVRRDRDEDQNHIDAIVKALNLTLPDTSRNTERIQRHYDFYFDRLRTILENSSASLSSSATTTNTIEQSVSPSNTGTHKTVDISRQLFEKLVLLQLTGEFTINKAAKIVLSRDFKNYDELWRNILVFSPIDRAQLALLIYYRTRDREIRLECQGLWMKHFHEFEVSIQRIFWRCMYSKRDIVASKKRIYDSVETLREEQQQQWNEPRDLVVLYQAVFELANELPLPFVGEQGGSEIGCKDSRLLFIEALRLLSPYGLKYRKAAAGIVRLSIETRLQDAERESTIQRYKFNTSLSLLLQSVYSQCRNGPNADEALGRELEKILKIINTEKGEISLRFA